MPIPQHTEFPEDATWSFEGLPVQIDHICLGVERLAPQVQPGQQKRGRALKRGRTGDPGAWCYACLTQTPGYGAMSTYRDSPRTARRVLTAACRHPHAPVPCGGMLLVAAWDHFKGRSLLAIALVSGSTFSAFHVSGCPTWGTSFPFGWHVKGNQQDMDQCQVHVFFSSFKSPRLCGRSWVVVCWFPFNRHGGHAELDHGVRVPAIGPTVGPRSVLFCPQKGPEVSQAGFVLVEGIDLGVRRFMILFS